jgi:hypothetical protein
MRLGRLRLRHYLDQGFMVLITGSKFFTGPPLSGALLVPAGDSTVMKQTDVVPAELRLYANQSDWPARWHGIRSALPVRPNTGQLLRWVAAVEEMRSYFAVPESYRLMALQEFARVVPQLIAARPNLQLLPAFEQFSTDGVDDKEMAVQTIFPFLIRHRGELASVEACGRIYRALNQDVSNLLPRSAPERQRQVAARLCHIGQPVRLPVPGYGFAGTLRVSAGARVVSETWDDAGSAVSNRKIAQEFEQVRTILDKIDLLVENIGALSSMEDASERPFAREAKGVLPFRKPLVSSDALAIPASGAKNG